jgi:hypothetical protein
MRIRANEIAQYRTEILMEQGHKCALCSEVIAPGEAVLDHDHKSGHIRGTLHRGCNALLGKIENSLVINRITQSRLHNILGNIESYTASHRPQVHPTHRTPEEKKLRAKKRAKLRKKRAT